jgi:zinc transport system ATP-binding protein
MNQEIQSGGKTPAVEVDNVSVSYGDFYALENISFQVPQAAFVAVIGPNGAGKSTLLHTMLGLLAPDEGTIRLLGGHPKKLPVGSIGYIPQFKTLNKTFPAVALELVVTGLQRQWPWKISTEERHQALEAMERTGVVDLATRAVGKLSGGELQRVYLARSLVRKPKLMFFDEPAAGMDLSGEADMYHILEHYRQETGTTICMITHDWEGARIHASHVLLLNRRVIGFGAPKEVAREENLLQVFGHSGHAEATHGPHAEGEGAI